MTSTGFLFIIVGIFILMNATNLVGVLEGNKAFNVNPAAKGSKTGG